MLAEEIGDALARAAVNLAELRPQPKGDGPATTPRTADCALLKPLSGSVGMLSPDRTQSTS
jgi:hypothetical protein